MLCLIKSCDALYMCVHVWKWEKMGAKCGQVMSAVCGPCEGMDIMVTGTM